MESVESHTVVDSVFVRHRNALMLRGQFAPIFTDYYLHLMDHGIRHPAEIDRMLKDALAMFTLHLTARPWAETLAWTANLRAPRINLFVTGGSIDESVTGRLFTEDVREPDRNYFYSQTTIEASQELRTSTLEIDGRDPVSWVEQFYLHSEQRPAKAFCLGNDQYVLVAAQPDCDMEWFDALDAAAVTEIEQREETGLLERRRFRFFCGCSLEKILPILGGWREKPEALFGGDDRITIQCPRCAARYEVTRSMLG